MRGRFLDDGYVILRGLLAPSEVERCVRRLEDLSGRTRASFEAFRLPLLRRGVYRAWTLPDGVSRVRDFWPLIVEPRLVAAVRELLGPQVRYLQHNDLQVGFSAVTWHRDNVNRRFAVGEDWDESVEPYAVVRVGLYLQSFAQSRFALRVVPGSHRPSSPAAPGPIRDIERRTRSLRQGLALLAGADPMDGYARMLETEPGDAILFDPRLLHAGSYIQGPKYSIFLAYGAPGRHSARHAAYYRYARKDLAYGDFDPALVALLREHGLYEETPPDASLAGEHHPSLVERLLSRGARTRVRA